ncbi:MAG: chemotaxis protein CheX [Phycisphaerae bacterium]|nr:chemotaxis protein CheX [Phycisphaerae bacterium]
MDRPIQQRSVEPFVASVENLFRTMLKQTVEAQLAQPGASALTERHVRATIRLSGDVMGSVTLIMPEGPSIEAVLKFVGKRMPFGSADFRDAVGELANMIAGGAVSRISGVKIRIGCPSIVMGPVATAPAVDGAADDGATVLQLPFATGGGTFLVELLMTEIGSAAKAA